MPKAMVEIVAKARSCMLCDLALAILEEIDGDMEEGTLAWEVVDVSTRPGLERLEEMARSCGQRPAVPSMFINQQYAFDHIPEMGLLQQAVVQAIG